MSYTRILKIIGVIWISVFLAGCGIATATPPMVPALPSPATQQMPPQSDTALPPSSPFPSDPTGAGCADDEYSAGVERIGVMRSTDQGATWTFLGHACFHAPTLVPVDPAPLAIEGGVALYFLDILTLRPESEVRIVYRAITTNGVDFTTPQPAFTTTDYATDPFVLRLPGGDYRVYTNGPEGLISASSGDGLTFTRDPGVRAIGAVPGALLLPSGDVRLFASGPEGISSYLSPNGLDFVRESGVRIPSGGEIVDGPHPIRLRSGGYLMAYNTGLRGGSPKDKDTVLATSADGLHWENTIIIPGTDMPGLVEHPDGSLFLYYVDFNYPGAETARPKPTLPSPPSLTPLPPPSPSLPVQPAQRRLVDFVETIQVTPDEQYLSGGFARINYVPARDQFVVTFVGELAQSAGGCEGSGISYKVYSTDMEEAGESGTFACDRYDIGSVMVGNTYYSVAMSTEGEMFGWRLLKIDAANWTTLVEQFHPVDPSQQDHGDPLVAFVNGRLDVSSGYDAVSGAEEPGPDTPPGTYGTHHNFFSPDLQFENQLILIAPPHIHGSSMVFVDDVYYLVTANLYDGDVIVAEYDADWNYLGGKTLIEQAHFPTGLAYDDQRFYVAYTDTSQRTDPGFFPVFLNIRLAVFDHSWNLLEDVAVTNYARDDHMQTGRPWVILHGNRLYVSYDVDTRDPVTDEEQLRGQAFVSAYELVGGAP